MLDTAGRLLIILFPGSDLKQNQMNEKTRKNTGLYH